MGDIVARWVRTGCNNAHGDTNSSVAEFGRQQGKLWANVMTVGGVAALQAFTPDRRGCGPKLFLHDRDGEAQGNAYATPVAPQPPVRHVPPSAVLAPPQVPPGWYPDPSGRHCSRWWDGARWTDATAPR